MLNESAAYLVGQLISEAERARVTVETVGGGKLIDCGIDAVGGLEAGLFLAEICMSTLGQVELSPASGEKIPGPQIVVSTDHPIAACMASQYAGWQIQVGDFFAMGSGPMRAAAAVEELFGEIGLTEQPDQVIGILETDKKPTAEVYEYLAEKTGLSPRDITLLVAPTTSLAGTMQVVARSVETALHKLHELKFDLHQVVSGWGSAPLPPPGKDTIKAIGRSNDAILYAGQVTLWVDAEDAQLTQFGPKLPSSASKDFGQPFAELFKQYDYDFYKVDKLLFSPAVIRFVNLRSGKSFQFGHFAPEIYARSIA